MAATTQPLKLYGADKASFEGHTLIVPAISIGSVPQLAVDLLIHHQALGLRYVGTFDSTAFCLPYACPPDSIPDSARQGTDESPLGLSLQLYSNSATQLTVLQQRSPTLKSAKNEFVAALTQWAKSAKIAQILILGTLDAALRVDAEMDTPLVHLTSPGASSSQSALLQQLPKCCPQFRSDAAHGLPSPAQAAQNAVPYLPGAGLTRLWLQAGGNDLPVGALLLFAHEGDNRGDAHMLAKVVVQFLSQAGLLSSTQHKGPDVVDLKEPRSWLTVFGPQMDQAIYG
ncbi:hypothetical protein OC861_001576 [Tilletia horrida]|nr:hypothetical protein OC861_001576 [Tilletia horrida]